MLVNESLVLDEHEKSQVAALNAFIVNYLSINPI